jgi:tRNA uridine 5-carbamoylmethylation protein Kti12
MNAKSKNKIAILQLCGLPAVGKTHFTRQYEKYLDENCRDLVFITLTYDMIMTRNLEIKILNLKLWKHYRTFIQNLIEMLVEYMRNGDFYTSLLDYILTNIRTESQNTGLDSAIIRNFNELLCNRPNTKSSQNFIICLDDNAYYESMRWNTIQLAIKLDCSYWCVCLRNDSLDVLLERNACRLVDEQVDPIIIESMFEKFEYPIGKFESEFSMITTSSIDEKFFMDLTIKLIALVAEFNLASFIHGKSSIERDLVMSRQVTSTNLVHQTDLILRKMIGKYMKSICHDKASVVAAKLAERKKDILGCLSKNVDMNDMFHENLFAYEKYLTRLLFDTQLI